MKRVKITCTAEQKKTMMLKLCASCPPYSWADKRCEDHENCKACWEDSVDWNLEEDKDD